MLNILKDFRKKNLKFLRTFDQEIKNKTSTIACLWACQNPSRVIQLKNVFIDYRFFHELHLGLPFVCLAVVEKT